MIMFHLNVGVNNDQCKNTKVCMWGEVPDVIIPIKFDVDRFRGFGLWGLKSGLSIDKASSPYNSSGLSCRL